MADQLVWFKYGIEECGNRAGHTVTFMPNRSTAITAAGCIPTVSYLEKRKAAVCRDQLRSSQQALYAIGGILKHCKALCAFTNPRQTPINACSRL